MLLSVVCLCCVKVYLIINNNVRVRAQTLTHWVTHSKQYSVTFDDSNEIDYEKDFRQFSYYVQCPLMMSASIYTYKNYYNSYTRKASALLLNVVKNTFMAISIKLFVIMLCPPVELEFKYDIGNVLCMCIDCVQTSTINHPPIPQRQTLYIL